MKEQPLRTTVIGSYPFPGWLEFACQNLEDFGDAAAEEMIDDAVVTAINDQNTAGLNVITDGEQTRLDFNLSFYGFLEGVELESAPTRRFGPPTMPDPWPLAWRPCAWIMPGSTVCWVHIATGRSTGCGSP